MLFLKHFKRVLREKHPVRFIISRVLLRSGIDTTFQLVFDAELAVRTYLHASSAAHKLFIGRYQPVLDIAVFKKYVASDSVVVDVGANIGMFSIVAAKLAPQGMVYAYEATPQTFDYLLDNVRLNLMNNVYPVYGAVCDTQGLVSFYEHAHSHEQNHIAPQGSGTVSVPAVPLQSHLDMVGVSQIDFLKIDVEGAELSVLQSLGTMLGATQVVYFESVPTTREGNEPDQVRELLRSHGFKIMTPILRDGELEVVPYVGGVDASGLNLLALKTN